MIYALLGILLVASVAADAFITVFSSRGGGMLTNLWTRYVWRALLGFHRRRRIDAVLCLAGPALLISIVMVWYLMLVAGWTLIYASSDLSVVNTDKQQVTQWHEKMTFVGVTLSTVGYGNQVPNGLPWTIYGNLTSLSGTILLTVSLSYVLAVLSAGLGRLQLASQIHRVGHTTGEFIERCWVGESAGSLDSHLLSVASRVDQHAHKHMNYPILRFFHSSVPLQSPSLAVLLFSDTLFLVSHGVAQSDRPPLPLLHVCERSVATYLELATSGLSSEGLAEQARDHPNRPPDHLRLEVLSDLGLPTASPDHFRNQWEQYRNRRTKLIALCQEDGWNGEHSQSGRHPERS